jgi:ABC-type antimicrobial peptide transport system permease subunit
MILRNLLRRKARTLLTLLGIAIGVAAMVALGAVGRGLSRAEHGTR